MSVTVTTVSTKQAIIIRNPQFPPDAQAVLELYRQTTSWHGRSWPDDLVTPRDVDGLLPEIEAMATDQSQCMLVADFAGDVVGVITAHLREPPQGGMTKYTGPILFIGDLVVHDAHRRSGLGTALMRAIEDWGSTRGVGTIELMVHTGNTAARDLYAREGYRPVHLQMRKDVDPTPTRD